MGTLRVHILVSLLNSYLYFSTCSCTLYCWAYKLLWYWWYCSTNLCPVPLIMIVIFAPKWAFLKMSYFSDCFNQTEKVILMNHSSYHADFGKILQSLIRIHCKLMKILDYESYLFCSVCHTWCKRKLSEKNGCRKSCGWEVREKI